MIEELLRPAVDQLADAGVYAMIDFHLIRPYVDASGTAEAMVEDGWASSLDDLGFDPATETDDLLVEFWSDVAPAFADDENVVYELFNEPTFPIHWSDYGEYGDDVTSREDEWLLWRDAAQPWVDLIRDHAPETQIHIGSPDWTSRTDFAPEYPFDGENLVYTGHIYPPNGLPEDFDDEYGAPAEEVPVVITEFGWDPDVPEDDEGHGSTSGWGEPFREWVESYDNVGWLAWCFDDSWGGFFDSGDDISEDWELRDGPEEIGGYVRDWLQETEADEGNPCTEVGAASGEELATGNWVCDLDGDGKYRDLTASGDTTAQDLQYFFENQHTEPYDSRPDLFDFTGNDDVGQPDVVDLFHQI